MSAAEADERQRALVGVAFGVTAHLCWGLVAIYFKAVAHVPLLEVLAHRIAWALVLLLLILGLRGRLGALLRALPHGPTLRAALLSTLLIAINWLTFIYAVVSGQILQGSLGYFINPLVNVLLGMVFLGERLRRAQWASVAIAAAGVTWLTVYLGKPPLIALTLALSFGFYGLVRKTTRLDAPGGLLVETALLLPAALGFLVWRGLEGTLVFGAESLSTDLLLAAGGPITALPLLAFVAAARRLRLVTMGFLQYIAPSMQFLLAVFIYDENFTPAMALAFAAIWTALAIYSTDAWTNARRRNRGA